MSNTVDMTDSSDQQGRPYLPMIQYTLRCIGCEKKSSKKGNPMLVFTWEIAAPDTVSIPLLEEDGTQRTDDMGNPKFSVQAITGMQTMDWIVLGGNPKSIERNKTKLKALLKILGLPLKLNIDDPAQLKPFVGKAVKLVLKTEGGAMKDEVTGEDMTGPDGQPITDNNYRIVRFVGRDPELEIPTESVAF